MPQQPPSPHRSDKPSGLFGGSFTIFRLAGFDVRIHWSWIIVVVGLTIYLGAYYLPAVYRTWTPLEYWLAGFITTILFFASVLAHEVSHSLVARSRHIPVQSITLFIFGGVSSLGTEPENARDEFWISFVGPVTSIVAGIIFFGIFWGTRILRADVVAAVALYLAYINVAVGVFNLLPGFPLDGGRVLRSILWRFDHNLLTATRIATRTGQIFAALLGLAGIYLILRSYWVSGIWLIFIAWFLWEAATGSYRHARSEARLRGLAVGALADARPPHVPAELTLRQFADAGPLLRRQHAFLVEEDDGMIEGLVTLSDLRKAPQERWDRYTVRQVMTPLARLVTVTPQTEALAALHLMNERGVDQLPVVNDHQPAGLLSRNDLVRAVQERAEAGVPR